MLQQAGRDPRSVKRSFITQVVFGENDAELRLRLQNRLDNNVPDPTCIIGTGTQIIDQISGYVNAGAERIMLQWLDLDDIEGIENLAKHILPAFHNSAPML
jgi:alkanesulfonate monooxygenase SsuD/methylene tetrahydromethanopterin reductase-like flavin-dependent oxidoreductase (luciferase family)